MGRPDELGSARTAWPLRSDTSRPALAAYIFVTSAIAGTVMAGLAAVTHEPMVFPSVGPTIFLILFAPLGAQSSPRNTMYGHLLAVISGYIALVLFGLTTTPVDLEDVTPPRVGAVTLSLALTLSLMVLLGVPHAPAAATALIVGLGLIHTPAHLAFLMVAIALTVLVCGAINRIMSVPYPLWRAPTGSEQND